MSILPAEPRLRAPDAPARRQACTAGGTGSDARNRHPARRRRRTILLHRFGVECRASTRCWSTHTHCCGGKPVVTRLSPAAARRLDRAHVVYVSPITCWEMAMLVTKGASRSIVPSTRGSTIFSPPARPTLPTLRPQSPCWPRPASRLSGRPRRPHHLRDRRHPAAPPHHQGPPTARSRKNQ